VQTVADGSARVIELRNGVPEFDETPPPKTAEVLFMARLHSRKRPRAFVEMASRILANGVDADFALVGPDEGELSGVMKMIGASGWSHRIRYERALSPTQTRDRLAASSILVLPSVDEPFPMVVLEAMAAGRPVVVTDSCGLAPIIQSTQSGIVVDLTIESLSVAVERLLTNPEDIVLRGQRARATAQSLFSMARVVTEWERAALTCGGTA
jgi:glycosyltransferase involved in cell wall biosynthesis